MKMKKENYKKNVGVNLIIFSYRRYLTTQKISRYDKKFKETLNTFSPVEKENDLELDFKVFFFVDSYFSGIVLDESN